MSSRNVTAVLVHGAWADGSSWSKVIEGLQKQGIDAVAAPLPLTSLSDDVASLDHDGSRRRDTCDRRSSAVGFRSLTLSA
jgi:hypothetical protein